MDADSKIFTLERALQWAFIVECARLDLPDRRAPEDRYPSVGTEYRLLERMRLGNVRIDTSKGRSLPHTDADTLVDLVSRIPDHLGGVGTAIMVMEMATTERRPDWMPGAVPKIVPVEWHRRNRFGQMAKTEVVRTYYRETKIPHPKNPARTVTRRVKIVEEYCPCMWDPSLQEITSARASYNRWASALHWIWDQLPDQEFDEIIFRQGLPQLDPWECHTSPSHVMTSATNSGGPLPSS